jgi:uncharacterized protein RhaS with RHS repeats
MIREDVNGTVTHRYVHRDHLGSITALTDEATGTAVARYSYDAWACAATRPPGSTARSPAFRGAATRATSIRMTWGSFI